jgi:uncharacterized protein involved in propanediol utilization
MNDRGECTLTCGKWGEFFEDHEQAKLIAVPFPATTRAVTTAGRAGSTGVELRPSNFHKTRALIERLLDYRSAHARAGGASRGIRVDFEQTPPAGHGLGTSTFTMLAGVFSVCEYLGIRVSLAWLGQAMAHIEPCDAPLTDGRAAAWDFTRGLFLSPSFSLPEGAYIGMYPLHRTVITDDVAQIRPRYTASERRRLDACYEQVLLALRTKNLHLLAANSSISADINQRYFPKPEHGVLAQLRRAQLIQGYFVAHSGSAFGVVTPPDVAHAVVHQLEREFGDEYCIKLSVIAARPMSTGFQPSANDK